MNRHAIRISFAFLLALLFLAVPAAEAQDTTAADSGRHMLWKIASEGGATEGYLVGSIHLMKPDAYPLGAAFDEAFAEADALVFELDLDSAQAQSQGLIGQMGMYPAGQSLETELSEETYATLQARAEELGLPLAQMQQMEPWVMSFVVPVMQIQRAGYNPQSGIDSHFFEKAKEAGKERIGLETAEEQMRLFDTLPAEKQEAFLKYSLQEAERNVEIIDEMVSAWKRGDAERLESIMQDEMQSDFPDLYDRLLVERNENWMPEITRMLSEEPVPMIVVGAGHVVGEDGLKALLEAEGYTVEQM